MDQSGLLAEKVNSFGHLAPLWKRVYALASARGHMACTGGRSRGGQRPPAFRHETAAIVGQNLN